MGLRSQLFLLGSFSFLPTPSDHWTPNVMPICGPMCTIVNVEWQDKVVAVMDTSTCFHGIHNS